MWFWHQRIPDESLEEPEEEMNQKHETTSKNGFKSNSRDTLATSQRDAGT